MYGIARFHIIGRLTRDAERTTLQNGTARVSLNLAINTPKKKQDGSYEERTTWMRIALFGKATERKMLEQCVKGAVVYADGNITSYEKQIGDKNYAMHNYEPDVIRVLSSPVRAGEAAGSRAASNASGGGGAPPADTSGDWPSDDEVPFA